MAYDGKLMAQARARYEHDKAQHEADFRRRRDALYRRNPRLQEIDGQLRATVAQVIAAALRRGEDTEYNIVSKLDDPDATSVQRVQVTGVSFDDLTLADWEAARLGTIEAPFTAEDYQVLEQ